MVKRELLESTRKSCVWMALFMLGIVVVYLGVVMLGRNVYIYFKGYAGEGYREWLRVLFYGIAMADVVFLYWIKGRRLDKERLARFIDDQYELIRYLLNTTMLTYALAEVPAICGLLLFFFGKYFGDFCVLALTSVALVLLNIPSVRGWEERIRSASTYQGDRSM